LSSDYYFISDIHLGFSEKSIETEKEKKLEKFLYEIRGKADTLFILGDLFDHWFEYKKVIPKGYFKTFSALNELVESGTEVIYFIGNHDFLHYDFFREEIGVRLIHDSAEFILGGKKFFMAHGDGLMANDTGYKILKYFLRNNITQKLFTLIHPDIGLWLAGSTSKKSRVYTTKRDVRHNGDRLITVAKDKLDSGFDYVIFGHSHIRNYLNFGEKYYINLGSWITKPCYGIFSKNKFEIVEIDK